jgi:uncharacterized protein
MRIACWFLLLLFAAPATGAAQTSSTYDSQKFLDNFDVYQKFVVSYWARLFAENNRKFVPPAFHDSALTYSSPCPPMPGAFYCLLDDTIYYDPLSLQPIARQTAQATHTDGSFLAAVVLGHEMTHAVTHKLDGDSFISVERENQADCFAGVVAKEAVNAKMAGPEAFQEGVYFFQTFAGDNRLIKSPFDSTGHGRTEERVGRFIWGYNKGVEGCGLWEISAPASNSGLNLSSAAPPQPQPASVTSGFQNAYDRALKENRILLMFFYDKSSYSEKEANEYEQLRREPLFAQIFAFGESLLPDDTFGLTAAKKLHVQNIPVISAFAPDPNGLNELSRHEGVWYANELRKGIPADICDASAKGQTKLDGWELLAFGCAPK